MLSFKKTNSVAQVGEQVVYEWQGRWIDACLTPHNLLQPVCQSVFGKAELFLMQLCECVRDWVIARVTETCRRKRLEHSTE